MMMPRPPNFIGIGVQKCASTWLYAALRAHPEVWIAPAKELNFFSCYYAYGQHWYERHFISPDPRIAYGEISPSYFCNPQAIARIYRYLPEVKLLVSFRDPIARAYSHHAHEVRAGRYQCRDYAFEEAVQQNEMYLEQSCYAKYLRQWYDYFPRDHVLVFFQEEIRQQGERECQRLYQFLGLSPALAHYDTTQTINSGYIPQSRWLDQLLPEISSRLQRSGLQGLIKTIKATGLPAALRAYNQKPSHTVIPPLKPATEQTLRAYFQPEMAELKQLLQRDTLPWSWA